MPTPRPVRDHFGPPQAAGEIGRFARYRVLRQLGEGGMGLVFLAEELGLGRAVALKFMAPHLAADHGHRARFVREARAAARIASDHVVRVFDVNEDGGLAYIAMERLAGASLEDRLATGPPAVEDAIRIGRETAVGLAAVHAAGLVHRDIKPANLWLEDPRGTVKVIDFGLAYLRADGPDVRTASAAPADPRLTAAGAVVGTAEYMAPEQAAGPDVDPRADLFSLGVVLYRLATGQRPFARGSYAATLGAVMTVTPPRPSALNPRVPPTLDALVMHLLAKNPADRPPSAAAVVPLLDRAAAELAYMPPVSLIPPPQSSAVRQSSGPVVAVPPRRRRASPAPLVAVGIVAVGAAVGGVFALRPPADDPLPAASAPEDGSPGVLAAPFTPAQALAAQQAWAKYLGRGVAETIDLPGVPRVPGGRKLWVVLIPPGTFVMGSPPSEPVRVGDEYAHEVRITKPFYLGQYEVTQAQFEAVMKSNPSADQGPDVPVNQVTPADAERFCAGLTVAGGRAGLPTEAQWEYACRAGTTTPFHFGDSLHSGLAVMSGAMPYGQGGNGQVITWHRRAAPVGGYLSNAFGLYDMHGNVSEWCQDGIGPGGPTAADARVSRGGGYNTIGHECRSACRNRFRAGQSGPDVGFRVAVRLD